MNGSRQIYFARCNAPGGQAIGAIKVGCSQGHEMRLKAIASNQPYSLELITAVPGDLIMETAVHLHLRAHRIAGEFFHESKSVATYIEAVKQRGTAFSHFFDASQLSHRTATEKTADAFRSYHGVSLEQVAKVLGVPASQLASRRSSARVVAATGLIVQARGYYAHWPEDALLGIQGVVFGNVAPIAEFRSTPTQQKAALA